MDANEQSVPRLPTSLQDVEATFKLEPNPEFDATINIQKAYDDYAAATGKDQLTYKDKQAAILAHVLRRSRHRWGWRELHPPSLWAGFLLSTLFWTSIGIAVGILSR